MPPLSILPMIDQKQLINEVAEDQYWIIITDGGRADFYEQIIRESEVLSLDEYQRAYNSGVAFTANWFAEMFNDQYNAWMFHGGQPIYSFKTNEYNYDEREHFEEVPGYEKYNWGCDIGDTSDPESVVDIVLNSNAKSGVIRFIQPHNPYLGMPISSEQDAKRYTPEKLAEHYNMTYRYIIPSLNRLIDHLDGKIIITSDHGQCLGDCDQYLHSPSHDLHEHLTDVPWHVVS